MPTEDWRDAEAAQILAALDGQNRLNAVGGPLADLSRRKTFSSVGDVFSNVATGLGRDIPAAASWLNSYLRKPAGEVQADFRATLGHAASDLADLPRRTLAASEARRAGGDYDPKPAVETSLLLAGGALPWAERNAAGIFGGRLSRTADQAALAEAERLAAQGVEPREIYRNTGWFRGADGDWKYWIDDSAARLTPRGEVVAKSGGPPLEMSTMERYVQHPELYAAYPKTARGVDAVFEAPESLGSVGAFTPGRADLRPEIAIAKGTADPRNVALHEANHLVQQIEGFAPGTGIRPLTEGTPAWDIYQKILNARSTPLDREAYAAKLGYSRPVTDAEYAGYLKTLEALRSGHPELVAQFDTMARKAAQREAYDRTAGEVESRAVEKLKDTAPSRDIYPPDYFDRPVDQQIVLPRPPQWGVPKPLVAPQGELPLSQLADRADRQLALPRDPTGKTPAAVAAEDRLAPPTGGLNPLRNEPVTFRGKEPREFTPDDWKAFGEHYGTDKPLGPLSPLATLKDAAGREFTVPGGTAGEWTYADLLHMKANPINPSEMDRALHADLQRKLGRTMTPTNLSDADVWNGLAFGMTSPNNPLFPNQVTASRLRLRTPEMLDDLAGMIPWKAGEEVTAAQRKSVSDAIAAKFGLQSGEKGGLGTRGTADYSRVGEMAQLFRENPNFFRKDPNESWGQAVERISSQLPGLSMKTGSFGTVWQDPAKAAISAIDRHMARELDKRGGIFADAAERTDWENRSVSLWNKREADRVAKQTKKNDELAAEGKATRPVAPADEAKNFDDLMTKSGSDGFTGEMLLDHVGNAATPKFRLAKGGINPDIPAHLAQAQWVKEPQSVFKMGRAYKQALEVNQKLADESGLNLFMSQWMEWDRIRNRFEPHENMFPGLSKLPAMSLDQLRSVDAAHKATGHKTYGKTPEGTLPPTRAFAGNASELGYLGIGGVGALGGLAALGQREQRQ